VVVQDPRPGIGRLLTIRDGQVVAQRDVAEFAAAYRDVDGSLWFGGPSGLAHREGAGFIVTPLPQEARNLLVQAIVRDSAGSLWVAMSRQGVFRLQNGQWTGELPELSRPPALVATADQRGNLWFGYINNRIARVHDATVRIFGTGDGLNVGNVFAICARRDHLWIGGELGLGRFDGARFVSVWGASGHAFTGISGIVETETGDLWLNGNIAISHISHLEVEHALRDPSYQPQYEIFDYRDGLMGTATQIRPTPTAFESSDGRLWFATTAGVVSIDPDRIKRNPLPPPVTIWSIGSGDQQYENLSADLRLPIHTTNLQIDYTAGSLTVPERVHFRYKLEGSDRDWQDVGNRHEAVYTNLGPGGYTFRVVAANNDGVWNNTGATIHFTIAAAFNQTKLFYALCALLCLVTLHALYKVRTRQVAAQVRGRLEARLAERERIARELHDTLLQGVQGLMLRFQAVAGRTSQHDPARSLLMEQALERADQILGEGRDRVRELRATAQDEVDLPRALAAEGEQLSITHLAQFRVSAEGARRDLHPIVREEVLLIAREALGNAFRHSGAKHIEAEVSYGDSVLHMRIRDDGRGISAEVLDTGRKPGHFGLLGMRERAGKIRAQLKIWSKSGAGTEIDLQVPAEVAYRRSPTASRRTWTILRWTRGA
jgi:signal transduction histidine kinase